MFTYFTDRDGKFQLNALAESGFDPLARTTKFMLTEEAHHMFVGESGVARVMQRTCEVMKELGTDDPAKVRAAGAIDLPTIQRYLNFHYSVTIDLFGADQSSNAAIFYSAGLKGRFEETKRDDDHVLKDATYAILEPVERQRSSTREVPMLNALNEVLRDDFIKDSIGGIERWNKVIEKARRRRSASRCRTRRSTARSARFAGVARDARRPRGRRRPSGTPARADWLPTPEDRAFVASLMGRVVEPGQFAGWIAPPPIGINRQPADFEYVRFN